MALELPLWIHSVRSKTAVRFCHQLTVAGFLLAAAVVHPVFAQQTHTPYARRDDTVALAERDLISTYKRCLGRLTTENQKALLEAGQAWGVFALKDLAAASADAGGGLSEAAKQQFVLRQMQDRQAHLETFFLTFRYPYADSPQVRDRLNADLEAVYAQCLKVLTPDGQARLRDVQREWILYRDLDADAAVLASRQAKRPVFRGYSAKSNLITLRTKQLREFYLEKLESPLQKQVPPVAPEGLAWTEQFIKDVTTLVGDLAAAKQESFFQTPATIKQITPLDSQVALRVKELQKRSSEKGRKTVVSHHLFVAEDTLDLLHRWNNLSSLLKDSNPESVVRVLPTASKHEDRRPEYTLIWESIHRWEEFCSRVLADYSEHVKRARSLADIGKISEAIKEYEAAFAIFENPQIAKEVMQLRRRSLGL